RQLIQIFQRFSRDRAVQQDHVTPVLLRHVAIRGNEAVDSSIMSVGDDAAVASRVVRQAVPEAKAVLCGRNSFRIFHSCDAVRLHQLDVPRFAASQKELHELGQFAWRSLHIAGRAQVDVLVSNGARRIALVDRKSTRLNSSHVAISYAVFCLKKKRIKSMLSTRRLSAREENLLRNEDITSW